MIPYNLVVTYLQGICLYVLKFLNVLKCPKERHRRMPIEDIYANERDKETKHNFSIRNFPNITAEKYSQGVINKKHIQKLQN